MQNFIEIERRIIATKSGFKVKNINDMEKKILMLLENKKVWSDTIKNFKKLCATESKKASLIIEKIYR